MRLSPLFLGLSLALTTAACADAEFTIENDSSFTFIEINLAPVNQTTWGQDLLGTTVLEPGDALELSGIDCGTYDIRIVDEDNDQCVLTDVDLCGDSSVWTIDDVELALCQF